MVKGAIHYGVTAAFGSEHVLAMDNVVRSESGFNPYAVNKSSGACGLFQFLPCSKMPCKLSEIMCQVESGMKYVAGRYHNPGGAWTFWQDKHWY